MSAHPPCPVCGRPVEKVSFFFGRDQAIHFGWEEGVANCVLVTAEYDALKAALDSTPPAAAGAEMSDERYGRTRARYFYATHTPHKWSQGPHINHLDPERNFKEIESLERAAELAAGARRGPAGTEEQVTASYGVEFKLLDGPNGDA